jgi:PTS system fructose-specific IIC component
MRLCELLDSATIKTEMAARGKTEAIAELLDLLVQAGRLTDRTGALEAVLKREAQQTTGIGHGVAVPHAKQASVTALTAALGISRSGIDFDAVDHQPVQVVFLLLAKINDPGPHIRALAEISRLLQVPGFQEKLIAAQTPVELLAVITAQE